MRNLLLRFMPLVVALGLLATTANAEEIKYTVTVVDSDSKPVAGAKVSCIDRKLSGLGKECEYRIFENVVTDNSGTAIVKLDFSPDKISGHVVIAAEKDGYAIGWCRCDRTTPPSSDLTRIILNRPVSTSGVVVDLQGRPLEGVRVIARIMDNSTGDEPVYFIASDEMKQFHTLSGKDGSFTFGNLPAGVGIDFEYKKQGMARGLSYDPGTKVGMTFKTGQDDVKLEMAPESVITGKVTFNGQPVAVQKIALTPHKFTVLNFAGYRCVSDEEGSFTLRGLPAGGYTLKVVQEGTSQGIAPDLRISLEAGQHKQDLDIQLQQGVELTVNLKDDKGQPVEEGKIGLYTEGYSIDSVLTDKAGRAQVVVLPGDYSAYVVRNQLSVPIESGRQFTVTEGKEQKVEIQLGTVPELTGTVLDKAGKPAAKIEIELLGLMSPNSTIITDADGTFKVSYFVDEYMRGGMKSFVFARDEDANLAVVQEFNEDSKDIKLQLKDGLVLSGTVKDSRGKAIESAAVSLWFRTDRYSTTVDRDKIMTDPNGRFTIKSLDPDFRFGVYIRKDGFGKAQRYLDTGSIYKEQADLGDIILKDAKYKITGICVDADDNPIEGVNVYIHGDDQPDKGYIKSDKDGKFVIDGICKGKLTLSANFRGESGNLHCYLETTGEVGEVKLILTQSGSRISAVPTVKLKGKAVPNLAGIIGDEKAKSLEGRRLAICLWNCQQRPSRAAVRQLAAKASALKEAGTDVVLIHVGKADPEQVTGWLKDQKVDLESGILADKKTAVSKWGTQSLPKIILTDEKHIVTDENVSINAI